MILKCIYYMYFDNKDNFMVYKNIILACKYEERLNIKKIQF